MRFPTQPNNRPQSIKPEIVRGVLGILTLLIIFSVYIVGAIEGAWK